MKTNYWQDFREGEVFHVYTRSISEQLLFHNNRDKDFLMSKIKTLLLPLIKLNAYCFMDNHFHLLFKVRSIEEILNQNIIHIYTETARKKINTTDNIANLLIINQIKRVLGSHAQRINKRERRIGALFQKRIKRIRIKSLEEFQNRLCYIHHNPIHHGATSFYHVYDYSSYNEYILGTYNIISMNWMKEINFTLNDFVVMHDKFKMEYPFKKYL
jgi:hypothetical protein